MSDTSSSSRVRVERALDAWQRHLGVCIARPDGAQTITCPAEWLDDAAWIQFAGCGERPRLLLTAPRAASLGLAGGDEGGIALDARLLTRPQLAALSDPLADSAPPRDTPGQPPDRFEAQLLRLARRSGVLPALAVAQPSAACALAGDWPLVEAGDIDAYLRAPAGPLIEAARAALPVEACDDATLICFGESHGTAMHLALVIGDITGDNPPLTRIHSSCVTGDIFSSLRCDCGSQLDLSLTRMAAEGRGVLLYLFQEGRGIGLVNKLRAYRLQERGHDTYEANLMLGFGEDERDFTVAASILGLLGVPRIRLLTNNPYKLDAIERAGVAVEERVPIVAESGRHNHHYLEAKLQRAGHLLRGE